MLHKVCKAQKSAAVLRVAWKMAEKRTEFVWGMAKRRERCGSCLGKARLRRKCRLLQVDLSPRTNDMILNRQAA